MALFITQCPYCHTSFRTSVSQLQSAEGIVRCGACLKIFVADDNLLPTEELQTVSVPPPAVLPDITHRQTKATQGNPPAAASQPIFNNTEHIFTLDLADSLAHRIEPSISGDTALWEILEEKTVAGTQNSTLNPEALEARTADLHRQASHSPAEIRSEGAGESFSATDFRDHFLDLPDEQERLSTENLAAIRRIEAPLEIDWHPRPASMRKRLLSWLLAALLIAALPAQYLWYNLDSLSQNPALRPWLERLCTTLPCLLPALTDIAAIRSENLVVRSHGEIANALSINLVFRNEATFDQPFPALNLRFTNTEGTGIASRRFLPQEYLPEDLADLASMPAGASVQVALDIVDPGVDAINYEVSFSSL